MGSIRLKQIKDAKQLVEKVNKIENTVKNIANPSLDGYEKPLETSAVTESDSLQDAIGKLEKALDGKQATGDYATTSSPSLTGVPTAPTASAGTNTAQIATTAFVMGALSTLINSAPETLDTIKELAEALGNDPSFSATVMNLIGQKLDKSGGTITGDLTVNGTLTANVTGNAATATKATGDKNGKDIAATYLPLSGGTMTNSIIVKNTGIARGTAPASSNYFSGIAVKDNNDKDLWGIQHLYAPDKSNYVSLWCKKASLDSDNVTASLGIGFDANGTSYAQAPTPANNDNSAKIATTAFVYNNANRMQVANKTIYVSNKGTGDGSSEAKAMSIADMSLLLATIKMQPGAGSLNGSYRLTIAFVPTDTTYGTVYFDSNKMPGVRTLTITSSKGNVTTENFSTNAPLFGYIGFRGCMDVILSNVQCSGDIEAQYGAKVSLSTYVGACRFRAYDYARIDFGNGTYNIHDGFRASLLNAYEFGQITVSTATAVFNFRNQCYYSTAIFHGDSGGRLYINYSRMKFTGTKPIVVQSISGTLTATSSTAAATAAKVAVLESGQTFSLTTNAVAIVKFTVDNTAANPTLNINNTGAKPIWYNGAAIPANYLKVNTQYKFKYDGTHFVCQNVFNCCEHMSKSIIDRSGDHKTTYNSGAWNFNGWSTWWGNCAIVGSQMYGNASTATKISGKTIPVVSSFNASTGTLALTSLS